MRHRKVHCLQAVRCIRCRREVYCQNTKNVICTRCEPHDMNSLKEMKPLPQQEKRAIKPQEKKEPTPSAIKA